MKNSISLPKALIDFLVLAPLITVIGIFTSDAYWWKQSLLMIIMLYGIFWFIWRLGLALFGFGISSLLAPASFIFATFIIMIFTTLSFPDYNLVQNDEGISQEVMAADCPDAKWGLTIHYTYNKGYHNGWESFHVTGNTEEAQRQSKKIADAFFENHPEFEKREYNYCDLGLYYLPRQYCKERGYRKFWSEIKNPDQTSEKQHD
jgi:hypothetical protein